MIRDRSFNTFDRFKMPAPARVSCAVYRRVSDGSLWAIQLVDHAPKVAAGPLSEEFAKRDTPSHFAAGRPTINATGWQLGAFTQVGDEFVRSSIVAPVR